MSNPNTHSGTFLPPYRTVLGGSDAATKLTEFDESKGIIIIGANCLIRMVNDSAARMFGYNTRAELVGKNVSIIVPPPFCTHHNTYIKTYIETGKPKILDNVNDVIGMHRDRFVIPLKLYVTKVSGIGMDTVFMGVLQQQPIEKNSATVWVMNVDMILSCDSEFTDWLGYKQEDVHGKPIKDLVVQASELEELVARMKSELAAASQRFDGNRKPAAGTRDDGGADVQPLAAASSPSVATRSAIIEWEFPNLLFKHRYLEDDHLEIDLTIRGGFIGTTAIFVFKLRRSTERVHSLLITDPKGRVVHVTERLAQRLGSSSSKMIAGGMLHALDVLFPAPFMKVHLQVSNHTPHTTSH